MTFFSAFQDDSILGYIDKDPIYLRDVKRVVPDLISPFQTIFFKNDRESILLLLACLYASHSFIILKATWPSSFSSSYLELLNEHSIDEDVFYLVTSGSTGEPKLVCHRISSLALSAKRSLAFQPIQHNSCFLLCLSPSAMGGLLTIAKSLLAAAALHVTSQHWLTMINHNIHWNLALVPQQLETLLNDHKIKTYSFSSILIGGDAVNPSLKLQAKTRQLPIQYSYGSTETCGQIMSTKQFQSDNMFFLLSNTICAYEKGELLVKTDSLALGYITPRGFKPLAMKNDYFKTNDLVDDLPLFKVIGRKDFQFQTGSKLISPELIEQKLKRSNIIEHILVVPKAHDRFGFVPIAYIVSTAHVDQIKQFSEANLPVYLQPKDYLQLPSDLTFSDPNIRQKLLRLINE